jgi:hypothetical protein
MIATRATRCSRSICLLLLLALAGCGGRSVRHEDDAAEGDDAAEAGDDTGAAPVPSISQACLTLCARCDLDLLVGETSCADFCAEVERQAESAACATPYAELVRCRSKNANACSFTACATQTNAFSVCVLSYCDQYPSIKPLCTAW